MGWLSTVRIKSVTIEDNENNGFMGLNPLSWSH